jgi:PAS domain S-box-containing protein
MMLAFAGVAAFSLALALTIVDRSVATDLERAAQERLEHAARVATRFLDDHLRTVHDKYVGLSYEPRFRAAVEEAGDEATLRPFAADLVAERGTPRVLFEDRFGSPIAAAGDPTLDALAPGMSAVELAARGASLFVVSRIPLRTRRPVGRLVAIERLDPETVAWWADACNAEVLFRREGEAGPDESETLAKVVRRANGIEMRVELSVRSEHDALTRARGRMLLSASAALAAAIAASLLVSRGIARPILRLKEAAQRIGGGDLSARTGVARADEIGDVARAVDDMAARLGESRSQLQALLDSLPFAVLLLDRGGERSVQYVNRAFERITGHARADAIGRPARAFLPQADAASPAPWDTAARADAWTARFGAERKDGTPYEQEVTVSSVFDAAGALRNHVAVVRDVTQEAALEAQLRQSQKMEAVGRLAGGIGHDFNNVLTVITGYSEILLAGLAPGDARRAELEEMKTAALRAAALTRQLLTFSRRQVVQPRVLDLNTSIAQMDRMLRRLIGEDIQFVVAPARDLGPIRADPGQVEQVLMNLVVNARDAMPRGGQLTIETANLDVDDRSRAERRAGVRPGRYAVLTVRDTGSGMDERTRAHIFEPFFTTKAPGKGTGLGLSTVYAIVERAGGAIEVESELGRGSAFRIFLPRVDEAAAPLDARHQRAGGAARGTETILVVEDDTAVRELAARILKAHGYAIVAARHGAEAIVACEQHDGPIHLLLTDIVMPHMSGAEVAERLATLRPSMGVVFMSGHTDSERVQSDVLRPGATFLQKPFEPEDLLRTVREALDARAAAAGAAHG